MLGNLKISQATIHDWEVKEGHFQQLEGQDLEQNFSLVQVIAKS